MAGCSGGDWDAVGKGWTLQRYEAIRRHWVECAPPAYVSAAVNIGYKPPPEKNDEGEVSATPEEVLRFLAGVANGSGR